MKYCLRCILPDTRPNLSINHEGVCSACESHGVKKDIDWAAREAAFQKVAGRAKKASRGYDCLIPVSGGKDSTWQVITCLEYGLNPLAMTWKSPARTELGAQNLANLVRLGVDHIDYQVNPRVESKFMLAALEKYGSTAIPMHMAIFNMPLNIALKFGIPLVVWGENSAFEYGAPDEADRGFLLDDYWLKRYGVTNGTTAADWVGASGLTKKDLTPYFGPGADNLINQGVHAVFLGYYFPWEPEISLRVARSHGFKVRETGPKTGFYNYADIDDDFISIHHFIKWYKFGFTRLWDNLALEIRNGRMTRDEAVEVIRNRADQIPLEDIRRFCGFTGITEPRFFEIIEKFRNRDIWKRKNNIWTIDNFLIPDRKWQ